MLTFGLINIVCGIYVIGIIVCEVHRGTASSIKGAVVTFFVGVVLTGLGLGMIVAAFDLW